MKEKLRISFWALTFTFMFFTHMLSYALTFPLGGRVKNDRVNVRSDCTVNSFSLFKLNTDEYVEIIGEKYEWYKIKLPKQAGCYVASQYLNKTGKRKVQINTLSLNMRTGPSLKSPVVGRLKKGMVLTVLGEKDNWTQVSCYPYAWGWVYKGLLEVAPLKIVKAKTVNPVRESRRLQSTVFSNGVNNKKEDDTNEKSSEAVKKKKGKTKKPPLSAPLVEGKLKKLKGKWSECQANYFLENEGGFVLVRIGKKIEAGGLINKNVRIWGKIKREQCVYIDAETIAEQ
ncbi:MAG: SH3 domain-containing protein [Candidatus Omnitrophica bacterium]|nr:SH3 domain-containing protein [Candidatus Omnitrophota bacterium]